MFNEPTLSDRKAISNQPYWFSERTLFDCNGAVFQFRFVGILRPLASQLAAPVVRFALIFAITFSNISNAEPPKMPTIIAHRGASQKAPENTLAACREAINCKTDWIEFDVREVADGGLYLFHDADLKRFNLGETKVETLTSEEAEKIDVGTWFDPKYAAERPPTLRKTLEVCLEGKTVPLIERKTGPAAAYIKVLRELDVMDQVVLQAFDWDFLEDARKLEPNLKLGALGSKALEPKHWEQLKRLKPDWVGWNHKDLTAEMVAEFQKENFKVAVWTVNDLARIRKVVSFGIDGLITDRPAAAREVVE